MKSEICWPVFKMRVHADGADVRAVVIGGQHTWLARCVMGLGAITVQYIVKWHFLVMRRTSINPTYLNLLTIMGQVILTFDGISKAIAYSCLTNDYDSEFGDNGKRIVKWGSRCL